MTALLVLIALWLIAGAGLAWLRHRWAPALAESYQESCREGLES